MWAGGRLTFHAPLKLGEAVRRVSTIADVSAKSGRSGNLVFVLVRHEIAGPAGLAITEEHDIVYRDAPAPGEAAPTPKQAEAASAWQRPVVPDDVLLFRYSALTFNGHRIHYDRRYVTTEEGYPGLIVHGPLLATLLADLHRREDARAVKSFNFRALSPVFDTTPFAVHGAPGPEGSRLWIRRDDGALCMEAAIGT
jgi:3-methylfumaryl-CoA hydratase